MSLFLLILEGLAGIVPARKIPEAKRPIRRVDGIHSSAGKRDEDIGLNDPAMRGTEQGGFLAQKRGWPNRGGGEIGNFPFLGEQGNARERRIVCGFLHALKGSGALETQWTQS
jgi:hypothetical protein